MPEEVHVATIHLPMSVDQFAQLCRGITDAFPNARARATDAPTIMEIWAPADDRPDDAPGREW